MHRDKLRLPSPGSLLLLCLPLAAPAIQRSLRHREQHDATQVAEAIRDSTIGDC